METDGCALKGWLCRRAPYPDAQPSTLPNTIRNKAHLLDEVANLLHPRLAVAVVQRRLLAQAKANEIHCIHMVASVGQGVKLVPPGVRDKSGGKRCLFTKLSVTRCAVASWHSCSKQGA